MDEMVIEFSIMKVLWYKPFPFLVETPISSYDDPSSGGKFVSLENTACFLQDEDGLETETTSEWPKFLKQESQI